MPKRDSHRRTECKRILTCAVRCLILVLRIFYIKEARMSYAERNIWVQVVAAVAMLAAYIPITFSQPLTPDREWLWPMLWAIGASIATVIVVSIVWNLAAGVRRGVDTRMDERDAHIAHVSDRVGQAFYVIAGVVAIVLCAVPASPFWIAHTLFFGFAASALIGGIASLVMYRVGAA